MFIWWPPQYIRPTRAQVCSTYTCYCQGNIKGQKERRRRWRTREGKTNADILCDPCLSKRSNSFCITSTSYPLLTPPTRSICSIALQVPLFIQTIQTKPLKSKRKKRTAPYHSCTSSWLLSSMSVVWRDSWFMSNSHQSCIKMLA